jgi:molybdopterin synthase sulfur carrier subunit
MKIIIPQQFQKITGSSEVTCVVENISGAINGLCLMYPVLYNRIHDAQGNLNKFINIYVNDEDIRFLGGIETKLKLDDVITLLPSIAGG